MSLHLTRNNAIFFHIQRTGGRWVGQALGLSGIQDIVTNHRGGNKNSFHEIEDEITDEYLFTFIRHPVAWYRSYWSVRTDSGWRDDWIDMYRADSFEEFLLNILATQKPFVSEHFKHYIGVPQRMDFVGLNENMANDLIEVLTTIKAEFDPKVILKVKPVNTSSSKRKCSREVIDRIIAVEDEIISKYYKNTPYEDYIYEFAL